MASEFRCVVAKPPVSAPLAETVQLQVERTGCQRHAVIKHSAGPPFTKTLGGMFQTFPWRTLLIKLAALFSFCGGPLVVADSLKLHVDKDVAFAIAFLPTVALIFGLYSLAHAVHDRWDRVMVSIGALGAGLLAAMNAFGVAELAYGPGRADAGLIQVGIAVGTVVIAYYAYASHKFFRAPRIAA